MSIEHDLIDPILSNLRTVCKENNIECIVMFANHDGGGGSCHVSPELQRFKTFHKDLYAKEQQYQVDGE